MNPKHEITIPIQHMNIFWLNLYHQRSKLHQKKFDHLIPMTKKIIDNIIDETSIAIKMEKINFMGHTLDDFSKNQDLKNLEESFVYYLLKMK
jgi:hypothetical protein